MSFPLFGSVVVTGMSRYSLIVLRLIKFTVCVFRNLSWTYHKYTRDANTYPYSAGVRPYPTRTAHLLQPRNPRSVSVYNSLARTTCNVCVLTRQRYTYWSLVAGVSLAASGSSPAGGAGAPGASSPARRPREAMEST